MARKARIREQTFQVDCTSCQHVNFSPASLTLQQVIGSAITLIGLIIIGVVVGVVVAHNVKKSPSSAAKTGSGSSNSPQVVNQTNPNDPSTFVKDSRLIQSFYGIAYTPEGSQLPQCGNKLCEQTLAVDWRCHADDFCSGCNSRYPSMILLIVLTLRRALIRNHQALVPADEGQCGTLTYLA
jgi:hypothetical protein